MKDIIVKDGNLFVAPNSAQRAETIIEKIQALVKKTNSTNIVINLCGLNMFECLKIASLSGAYGLINNIRNHYEIIVDNEVVKAQIQLLSLANVNVSLQQHSTAQFREEKLVVKI